MSETPWPKNDGYVAEIAASGDAVCAVAWCHGESPQQLLDRRRQLRNRSEAEEL